MLKRIAIVDGSDELFETVAKAAENKGLQAVKVTSGEELPVATAAVLSAEANDVALDLAVTLGERQEDILHLLAEAIDCREGLGAGTSRRLMEHATRFAQALGLDVNDELALERSALLRDIGKLRISNEALLKDGVLNYDEWLKLQCHPRFGAEMIRKYGVFADTEDIIRCHHECFDGDGYPDGMEGDEIPYLARVMKIIDVYCAMTSPRHYRKGHASHESAVEYLQSEAGKHFDPDLIASFVKNNIGQATLNAESKETA